VCFIGEVAVGKFCEGCRLHVSQLELLPITGMTAQKEHSVKAISVIAFCYLFLQSTRRAVISQ
jgi:hypothetical protein